MFLTLLGANAAIGFAYAKNEIISLSGVFYALLAAAALRDWLAVSRVGPAARRAVIALALVSSGWAMWDVGLHAKLVRSAFEARDEWGSVLVPGNAGLTPVAVALGEEALTRRARPASRLPRGWFQWWEPK